MDNPELYFTAGLRQRSQRSTSAPVMPDILSLQKIITNITLSDHRSPLLSAEDSESDGSGQEEELVLTPPEAERCIPPKWVQGTRSQSAPSKDCGAAKSDEELEQTQELQAVHDRKYGSGQYFRLAHEYAESAHAAAQLKLRYVVTSVEYDAISYSTGHSWYYPLITALDGQQHHNVHAQAHSDLFGIPGIETGNELNWTLGVRNSDSYGEPGEAKWFYTTE